jgi:hypothetical protein
MTWLLVLGLVLLVLVGLTVYDATQKTHTIRRNFPLVGRFRYLLEKIGPSCGSTSSRATTTSGRSTATSGAGSTPAASRRTTTSPSAPTTRSR